MSTMEIGITRIGQIQIRASNVERAVNFYENVLGLKLLFKAPPGPGVFRLRRSAVDAGSSREGGV